MNGASDGGNLFGASGWVQRLLVRVTGSADSERTSRRAAFVLGVVVLVPPFVLAAWRGTAWGQVVDVPFLRDFDALTRLAVVVPVLVLASRTIGGRLSVAMRYLERAALVSDADRLDYQDAKLDVERRVRSPLVGVLLLVAAFVGAGLLFPVEAAESQSGLSSWMFDSASGEALSPGGWWYSMVSRPLVAFFLLLWGWRYLCWCLFLRRLGNLELQLLAAHPDLVGGLAPLVQAHTSFVLVGVAVNAALSGALANELLHGGLTIAQVGPEIAFFTVIGVVVIAVPLAVFTPGLMEAKQLGLIEYGRMGTDITLDFDTRWKGGEARLLDTADPSAMADFSMDYSLVKSMSPFPLGLHQLGAIGVILLLPFGALALTQVSLTSLLRSLLEKAL